MGEVAQIAAVDEAEGDADDGDQQQQEEPTAEELEQQLARLYTPAAQPPAGCSTLDSSSVGCRWASGDAQHGPCWTLSTVTRPSQWLLQWCCHPRVDVDAVRATRSGTPAAATAAAAAAVVSSSSSSSTVAAAAATAAAPHPSGCCSLPCTDSH